MSDNNSNAKADYKKCTKCGVEKEATIEFYNFRKESRDNLSSWCKECYRKYAETKRRKQGRPLAVRARLEAGKQECTVCKKWYPATTEFFTPDKRRSKGIVAECRNCSRARGRDYYRVRPHLKVVHRERARDYRKKDGAKEKAAEYSRMYRKSEKYQQYMLTEEYKQKQRLHAKAYRSRNRIIANQRSRDWERRHPERTVAKNARRRSLKMSMPLQFEKTDWQRALDYFNGCCAVCGRQLRDLFATHKPAADHWIALTDPRPDNPGTVPWNIVPLCHGEGGCNNSKANKPADAWLLERFGKKKATEILARINAYFEWVTPLPQETPGR